MGVYDPNFRPQLAAAYREAFLQYVPLAHLIKVSKDDLTDLMTGYSSSEGLEQLRDLNPDATMLLTPGEEGARLLTPRTDILQAGYRIEVADTVGAGDASIAALLYAVLCTPSPSSLLLRWPVPPPPVPGTAHILRSSPMSTLFNKNSTMTEAPARALIFPVAGTANG